MKRTSTFIFVIMLFSVLSAFTQNSLQAVRISEPITIDGILDEAAWVTNTQVATDFVTLRPKAGLTPEYDTQVKVIYDDDAIYVSAFMPDVSRDSIMTQLTERDNIGNTDFFGFMLDTYGNQSQGYEFILASTGVQFDALVSPNNEDSSWDAVWFGAVHLSDEGWTAEMKIPYAAIRFQKREDQEWRVNFFRRRAVSGEQAFWKELDVEQDNAFLQSCGNLTGISDVNPPLRLSLSPYASVYGIHSHDQDREVVNSTGYSYNAGVDVKYGINDAFTLDMTLIPDFGQVQADDEVLNLSPFEIRFDENRPFFTEGVDLFEKAGIFYTRRVGMDQQLYNATKVSGRTGGGLGLGFFNAVGAQETSTYIDDETGEEVEYISTPLTNYNVSVIDKQFSNNANIGFINTNVTRFDDEFDNANVSAVDFDIKDKKQMYGVSGKAILSQKIRKNDDNINGHNFEIEIEKLSGKYTYGMFYSEISPDYDHNDLGFLRNSNVRNLGGFFNVNWANGFGMFDAFQTWSNVSYRRIVEPNEFTGLYTNAGWWGRTKAQWQLNMWANLRPATYDYFEPRVEGVGVKRPGRSDIGYWIGTDNRKKIRLEHSLWTYKYFDSDWKGFDFTIGPRYRVSDNFNVFVYFNYFVDQNVEGYVNNISDTEIYFGRRDERKFSNLIGAKYTFNQKMSLDVRVRHYWAKVTYKDYLQLDIESQELADSDYDEFHDLSFNAFTANATFTWRFAPGSDIFVVWKNDIVGAHQNPDTNYEDLGYFSGVRRLKDIPQNNSLSLRLVYYLDYQGLKNVF